jgi:hypothetical protein
MDTTSFSLLNSNVFPLLTKNGNLVLALPFDISDDGDGSEIVDIMHAAKPNAKAEVMFPASCYPFMESGRKLLWE